MTAISSALNSLIILLLLVRASLEAQTSQVPLADGQKLFLENLPFSPSLMIESAHNLSDISSSKSLGVFIFKINTSQPMELVNFILIE